MRIVLLLAVAMTIASCSGFDGWTYPEIEILVISVDNEKNCVEAYNNGSLQTIPIYETVDSDSLKSVLTSYKENTTETPFPGKPVKAGRPDKGPQKGQLFVMSY